MRRIGRSSKVTPALLARDPENRLLARGPRFRLPAEIVRDNALAIAGLLTGRIGGPSVKPYQPAGLWEELAGGAGEAPYVQEKGPASIAAASTSIASGPCRIRSMATFDAPSREICQVKRPRTNTPLQALELLNDVTYVEAARQPGRSSCSPRAAARPKNGSPSPSAARPLARPTRSRAGGLAARTRALPAGLQCRTRSRPPQLIQHGDSPLDPKLDPVELAAYTATAERHPQPGRDDHTGMNRDVFLKDRHCGRARSHSRVNRRHFLARSAGRPRCDGARLAARPSDRAGGIGDACADAAACRACRTSRRRPSGSSTCSSRAHLRSSTCSITSRRSRRSAGIELPDSVRMGQRITTMTSGQKSLPVAPSIFKFARHGQSGAWLSELLAAHGGDGR